MKSHLEKRGEKVIDNLVAAIAEFNERVNLCYGRVKLRGILCTSQRCLKEPIGVARSYGLRQLL